MNFRKFCFISCSILAVFLFFAGLAVLYFIGAVDSRDNYWSDLLGRFKPEKEPFNVLVLGGDKVAKNTDTIILVNYNPSTAKINLLSIPRDTKVHVKGSGIPKINSAYPIGGGKLAVDTVSSLLGVKIKYFVYIDTSSFRKIIDILGGVDYYVPVDMDYDDPVQNLHIHLKKGYQHLDGQKAEQFMRFRQPSRYNSEIKKYYDGSDLKRIDAQQTFIKEVIRQKANVYYFTKLNSIIATIYKNIETNIKLYDALKLSRGISKFEPDSVSMFKLPGEDSHESGGWYFVHDKVKTQEIISRYFTSKSGFVDNNINNNKEDNNRNKNTGTGNVNKNKKSPVPAVPKNENANANPTKDNPSNGETSIEGNNKPMP